jgi:predicted Zn-dependent protease
MGARGDARARQAIESARLRFGVRPGSAELSPAEEAERARAWFAARTAMDSDQLARAEADLRRALQQFGDDAGLLTLRCEAAVRRSGTGKDPSGACERAVKLWEEMPRALFWSALAKANEGNRNLAVARLQRSRKMDPSFDGPWKVLADIYRFEGRRADLVSLRTEYQIQFGKPLR